MAAVTILPLYLADVHASTPARVGLLMMPFLGAVGVGSIVVGQFVRRSGRTMIFPTVGLAVVAVLFLVQTLLLPQVSDTGVSAWFGIIGLFLGTTLGVVQVTAQTKAGLERQGVTAASIQLSRSLESAIGVSIAGAVYHQSLSGSDAFTSVLVLFAVFAACASILAALVPVRRI